MQLKIEIWQVRIKKVLKYGVRNKIKMAEEV